jgi:hypothetical protein
MDGSSSALKEKELNATMYPSHPNVADAAEHCKPPDERQTESEPVLGTLEVAFAPTTAPTITTAAAAAEGSAIETAAAAAAAEASASKTAVVCTTTGA